MKKVDPITLAVVRNNLISVANGMQETAFRCAVTTYLYEIMDCSFSLLDDEAGVIAEAHGMLLFLGSLGPAVRNCIDLIGKENLSPGDIIVAAHPDITGAHTSDALVFSPIFYKKRLFGFAATKSHWLDLGAKDAFPTNSRSAFEEGLRIPPVRIYRKGELQQDIWEIIRNNSRTPDMVWGDMQAQIAGCRFAEKGVSELLDRYGEATVRACIGEMYDYSERMIRQAIEQIPDGTYCAEDFLDDNGIDFDTPLAVKAAITVKGSDMTIDLSGSAPEQPGPVNGLLISTISGARVSVKALMVPELPGNEGFARPIKVIAPVGSIFNSTPGKPSFLHSWVAQTIMDLVNKALHQVLPEKVPALSGGDVVCEGFAGVDPKTGRYWGTLTPVVIGQGGDSASDGESFLYPLSAGACRNSPTEVIESTFPLIVDRCELIPDSGGPGRHRGGVGSRTVFRLTTPGIFYATIEKGKMPHWGIFGGKEGLRNYALVHSKKQGEFEVLKNPAVFLDAGDSVSVTAGGGGGYGDPLERDPEAVREDVIEGYVTPERARSDYGVVMTPGTFEIDRKATRALRKGKAGEGSRVKAEYGYMGKMLFVDLTNGLTHEEDLTEELARGYVGGYGIGARIIYERTVPGIDPLGPESMLGIGTGPFTACGPVSTSRFITMGKSPLTGYWGDANSGGNFAPSLKAAGYDIVFFQGKADHPVYLLVTDDRVEIRDARHLWGKNSVEAEELLRAEVGTRNLKVACIGTAGERLARIAAIMNDTGRAAARSGLGAVMGSKNLKALACGGSKKPRVFDKQMVQTLNKQVLKQIADAGPGIELLKSMGTAGAMVPHLAMHATPIKNFGGNNVDDFPEERWGRVGFEALEKYVVKKYACTGCPIACGGILTVGEGRYATKNVHKPEYESLGAFGPNCLIDDMDALIYANELCNLAGLDTISAGCAVSLAIECYENGLLTRRDTDGLELTWGNADAMIELLKKMSVREGIGDLFADGPREAARRIGRGAERLSMDVGGEGIPMHNPREADGWGAAYVADPTPARHTRSGTMFAEAGHANPLFMDMLGIPRTLEKYSSKGKGTPHARIRAWMLDLVNNTGLCLFCHDSLAYHPLRELMGAVTGWEATVEELIKTGMRISTLLHAFNLREGFKPDLFTMPARAAGDPPFKVGPFKDRTIDFEELKWEYYRAMGFDCTTGVIEQGHIDDLGLQALLG